MEREQSKIDPMVQTLAQKYKMITALEDSGVDMYEEMYTEMKALAGTLLNLLHLKKKEEEEGIILCPTQKK